MGLVVLMPRKRLRYLLRASIVVAGLLALYWLELVTLQDDYFRERAAALARTSAGEENGGTSRVFQDIVLESSDGLVSSMRVKRPNLPARRLPVVLIAGGERTGRHAVDLVDVPGEVAYAAIDYPYTGSRDLDSVTDILGNIPALQRAFLDTPPALILALRWLQRQDWVDESSVELVGVSLGVPFAAVAGAMEPSFSRVWLIHGGISNVQWISHALEREIENDWTRGFIARTADLLVYGRSFDTRSRVLEIAPRPVVIVAAQADERVPDSALRPLEELAGAAHVELVLTDGRHIGPRRDEELQQLLAIVRTAASAGDTE
jgi:hypothetical protein